MRAALKAAVFLSGTSQRRIAAEAAVSEASLSNYIRRVQSPKPETASRISHAPGRPVADLFPELSSNAPRAAHVLRSSGSARRMDRRAVSHEQEQTR